MPEELVRGLSDEDLTDYEAKIEKAMTKALEQVMDTIAKQLGRSHTAPTGPQD